MSDETTDSGTQWRGPKFVDLAYVLANLYLMLDDARVVTERAKLSAAQIRWDNKAITNWMNILEYARAMGRIEAVIDAALVDYPNNDALLKAQAGSPPKTLHGPEPSEWRGPKTEIEYQRLTRKRSTLVSVRYLKLGLVRGRSVVRILRADDGAGTGFLTTENLLITNHHVLDTPDQARGATVWFNYEENEAGQSAAVTEARLDPDVFWRTSEADDWTAVAFASDMTVDWGGITLEAARVMPGDWVNIIQHPSGLQKQLSIAADVVVDVQDNRIQYMTDTMEGSSGAPVFDRHWNLVALHHAAVRRTETRGGETRFYRNQGIPICRVIDGLGRAVPTVAGR